MKRNKAFTLIELLVVIAIIALLLSILMPSLQRVKKQAQAVVGISNLKQLNLGLAMYGEEYNGKFWKGWLGDARADESNWWMPSIKVYAGDISKLRFCRTATRMRWKDDGTGNTPGIGWGKEPFTAWGYSPWLDYISLLRGQTECDYGSFAANGWMEDKPIGIWPPDEDSFFWRNYNKIPQAETVPFLTDGQWIDTWPKPNMEPPPTENENWQGNNAMYRIVQNRHNGSQNMLFMDGSARKIGLKELWTFKWHREYNTRGKYTLAGGASRGMWPNWMQGLEDY